MRYLALLVVASLALAGCGAGDTSASDVKTKEAQIDKANKEMMEKNPPPPGEGPGN